MKKYLILLIIVLVLIAGCSSAFYYISQPKMITHNSEPVVTCADTDGNDIYEKGYSSYEYSNGEARELRDVCDYFSPSANDRIGLVRESYCDGNNFKTEEWSCGFGYVCRNGACIKGSKDSPICIDSDGGNAPKIKGEIYGNNGMGFDQCWLSNNVNNPELDGGFGQDCNGQNCYIYEYYCGADGDSKEYSIQRCESCSSGVCL